MSKEEETGILAAQDLIARAKGLPEEIGVALDKFGGVLRCGTCGYVYELQHGDTSHYTAKGWPKHCDRTMTWWTKRQIDAGEMPA